MAQTEPVALFSFSKKKPPGECEAGDGSLRGPKLSSR
mgnify:CR=1 FL=1